MTETVTDNRALERYELDTAGGLAFIDYRRTGAVVTLVHAEVPAALQGHGLGSRLVRGALDLVRAAGEKVVPRCPFVVDYVNRHCEVQDLLARPPAP